MNMKTAPTEMMSLKHSMQPTDQLCFLHIVKTAGSSFSHHLKNQFSAKDICPAAFWPDLLAMPENDRNRYKLITGHFSYDIEKYLGKRPVYVTMLRDPIERTVSVYEYMKWFIQTARSDHDYGRMSAYVKKFHLLMNDGMESFIKSEDKDVRLAVSNTQTLILAAGDPNSLPDMVGEDLLERAKANLKEFVFFGLTERMQESLELLSCTFGWRPFKNVQVNITPNKSRISGLSSEVVNLITDMNRLDMELYKYANELFTERYALMVADLNNRYPVVRSSIPGADETSLLHDQLEQHYEQCYRENPAIVRAYSFKKALGSFPVGEGWWQWEDHGKYGHRWTGPGTVSTLDIPLLTDRPLFVSFRIIDSITPDVLKGLHLKVNGCPVESTLGTDPDGFIIIRALLTLDVLKGDKPFVHIDLIVNRTVSAKEIDPTLRSDRKLGIAIHSMEVHPFVKRKAKFRRLMMAFSLKRFYISTGRRLKRKIRNWGR